MPACPTRRRPARRWGLDTLTHANSAATLWAPGLSQQTLCSTSEYPVAGPVVVSTMAVDTASVAAAPVYEQSSRWGGWFGGRGRRGMLSWRW